MIKEYQTAVNSNLGLTTELWSEVTSFDLRYVATASPAWNIPEASLITVNGSAQVFCIREEYSRFTRDWHSVRR